MSKTVFRGLWTGWYEATKDLGLKRGNPDMIGDHIPVREFYYASGEFEKWPAAGFVDTSLS
jgi:hypothetical protein